MQSVMSCHVRYICTSLISWKFAMFAWTCQPSLAFSTIPRQMWEHLGSSPQLLRWTSRIRLLQMIVTFEQLAIKNAGYGMPKIDFFGKIWPSGNSTAAAFGLFTGDSAISHCTGWIAIVFLRSNDHVCKIQQQPGHDSRNTAANALWADEGSDWISTIQVVMSSDFGLLFVSLQV